MGALLPHSTFTQDVRFAAGAAGMSTQDLGRSGGMKLFQSRLGLI